ncbi:oligosaccharide flippase family protein [Limnobacter sp.]|uniref:oligosaccharide flippase family protein n=1 Tax=Limnobacter sp. TaxID=2003368 RepID=UPI003514152F
MSSLFFSTIREATNAFRTKLVSGFGWNLVSTICLQGSVLLTGLILARVLGLETFGVYALATTTVMTIVGVAQGGVGIIGTKFVGEWLYEKRSRIGGVLHVCAVFTLTTGIAASLLLAFGASWLAEELLDNPGVAPTLQWASMASLFHVQTVYLQGALQGFGAFRAISAAGAWVGLLHLLCSLGAAWAWSLDGAIIAFCFSAAARWWLFRRALLACCRDHGIVRFSASQSEDWLLIWRFALPAGLASLVTLPCLWGVTALVARQPNGFAWVGLFAVAHQIRQSVLQLPILLNTVTSSVLSRLKGRNQGIEYWLVFRANLLIGLGVSIPAVITLAYASENILDLYGPGFKEGQDLLLVLLLSVIPELIGVAAYQLVQSSGRMWQSLFFIIIPRDFLYLTAAAWMLHHLSLVGAGWAYFTAYCIGCVATMAVGVSGRQQLPKGS